MRLITPASMGVLCALALLFTGCSGQDAPSVTDSGPSVQNTDRYLTFVDDDPDIVDPQCTSEYYNIALNVFDRLVEVETRSDGSSAIVPSLAESWEISPDGTVYTFHLHESVQFSNGALLTASDVGYTLTRLLTHPDSCNQDIAEGIAGADALMAGETDRLEGFRILGVYDFSITLEQPYAAFLACLSTPGASILDEDITTEAGDRFGRDPAFTIGTGPFIFREWHPGSELILDANPHCWSGPPRCAGLLIRIVSDMEAQRLLFQEGGLDILDLDNMGSEAEFFIHGDIYQNQLAQGPRVGITYIALNQSVEPLNDVRVRKALQLSLNRQLLLDAAFSGRGAVENGIFPHGLIGYNPDLPEIPYDPAEAVRLLEEAGYADGFDLTFSVSSSTTENTMELLTLAAAMWQEIGVRVEFENLSEEKWMEKRRSGEMACYSSTWSADFNDPDNFIYTFFGNRENTLSRSLGYPDLGVMRRVWLARAIVDEEQRLAEYRDLERKIVQEDAAWVPLFSKQHYFVVSRRVDGFRVSWNGWSNNKYRNVAVLDTQP